MMGYVLLTALLLALPTPTRAADAAPKPATLTITPAEFVLQGSRAQQRLLVTGGFGERGDADLTASATYESLQPNVAVVDRHGNVTPRSDGTAEIVARYAGLE